MRGPVSLTDVLPTVLDLLGLPAPAAPGGTSFLPLLRGREDPARRAVLLRLVMMFAGDVQVDAGENVSFRQVMVEDAFRAGPIKMTRSRTWPQFPADAPAAVRAAFQREAAAQYAREDLRWLDVARFPAEPPDRASTELGDAAAHAALDGFRRQYTALAARRRRQTSPLPDTVRLRLESLGYVDTRAGPQYSEPDAVLPPPGG